MGRCEALGQHRRGYLVEIALVEILGVLLKTNLLLVCFVPPDLYQMLRLRYR